MLKNTQKNLFIVIKSHSSHYNLNQNLNKVSNPNRLLLRTGGDKMVRKKTILLNNSGNGGKEGSS